MILSSMPCIFPLILFPTSSFIFHSFNPFCQLIKAHGHSFKVLMHCPHSEPCVTSFFSRHLFKRTYKKWLANKSSQNQQVSPKTDVYCFGIVILEIITGKFPSQYHSNGKGGTDVVQWVFTAISERREEELIDPAISSEKNSLSQMLQLLQIGAACTESNPEQRLTIKEAIRRIEEI